MKVAFVSRFPRDIDKPRGGVETATVGLARALKGIGVEEVHVVTLERERDSVTREQHEGIEVHRLPRSPWPMILDVFFGPSASRLKEYLHQLSPDVVHFQETWGLGSARYGIPHVFTVHGFDSKNLPAEKRRGWRTRSLLWRIAESRGLQAQKMVVSIAPYVTRMIQDRTSAEIFDIWNCLDRRYFELSREERPETVLFLGWINSRKNPMVLVEVAALLKEEFPSLQIRLGGEESDPAYARDLRSLIDELGVGDQVRLLGRLSQSEVMAQIKEAAVLILPSLQENAPMVIAESMAMGLPVIASNRCGIPDMLTDGESGFLVEPNDAEMIAERLARLLRDDTLRKRTGGAARGEAYQKFHPDSVAEATMKVYRRAVSLYGIPSSEAREESDI